MAHDAGEPTASDGDAQDDVPCPHETLTPRWRDPDAMGDDSRAMGFVCHRCHREFAPYLVEHRRLKHLMI